MSSESDAHEDHDSDVSIHDTINNMNQFQQMLKLCRENKEFPPEIIEDMNKMYKKCSDKQKNEEKLCNLILEGIKHISPTNKTSFNYAADVYNELLQLPLRDFSSSQTEINVPSTSKDSENVVSELENGISNKISKSNGIFKQIIKKCYENPNFPNSNIAIVDKLYDSLPIEFLDSKYFIKLLEEVNQVIWPDSNKSLYAHIGYVHNQLNQFEASMKVQKRKISVEDKETVLKKQLKLKKLKHAFYDVCKKIKALDEEEMDINDDNNFELNSPYILKDKYEKRALEIYKRMCKLRDEPDFLKEPPLRFKKTDNSLVNKTIEKYYNMNKIFPCYFEIYTLLKLLNEKKQLNWNETTLKNISQNAFLKLGKQLKIRRLNDYFGSLEAMITKKDPAEDNPELKKKLDESSKKLYADLNELSRKFQNQQDYAEETEGSNLNDTDCEHSSEEDNGNKAKKLKREFKHGNPSSVKRKRVSSNNLDKSDKDEPLQKSQKTIYLESFDLTPCNTSDNLINNTNKASDVATEKVPDIIASTKIISEIEDTQLNETTNKTKNVTDKISKKIIENINNGTGHSYNKNVVQEEINSDNGETLVIDEDISVGNNINGLNSKEPDQEFGEQKNDETDYSDFIVTEPEVILHIDESPVKDVIEINELDDSDVEITSCDPPKVPLLNKQSLDSIIKSMNVDKKNKRNKQSNEIPKCSNSMLFNDLGSKHIPNPNMNNNLVNRWVMNNSNTILPRINYVQSARGNNVRPPRVKNVPIRYPSNCNRPFLMAQNMHRMQSTFQKSTTQTETRVTQRLMNSLPHQRNFMNNQSVLQQRVTTMTTTTMVQQIVQQSSQPVQGRRNGGNYNHRPHHPLSSEPKSIDKPELIELD